MGRNVSTLDSNLVEVISNIGFSAGDPVYTQPAGLGRISDDFTATAPYYLGGAATAVTYDGTRSSGYLMLPDDTPGGQVGARPSAKLSNGNIVTVYWHALYATTFYPSFTIHDENGAVVVARTTIGGGSFTSSSYRVLGVVALVGGGFAVYFFTSNSGTNRVCVGVYTNTGAVTTAPANETSFTAANDNYGMWWGTALPGGGFHLLVPNNTGDLYHKFYSATRTTVRDWNTDGMSENTATSSLHLTAVTALSDDSVVIATAVSGTINTYKITTGGTVTSSSVALSSNNGVACCTLSDDSVALVVTNNSGSTVNYYRLTSATSYQISSITPVVLPISSVGTYNFIYTHNLSGTTNWALFYTYNNDRRWTVFDASGAPISGNNQVPNLLQTSSTEFGGFSTIEVTDYLYLYISTNRTARNTSSSSGYYIPPTVVLKISKSTWEAQPWSSVPIASEATGTGLASAYSRSNSTAIVASFKHSADQNVSGTAPNGVLAFAQKTVAEVASLFVTSCTLSNGRVAVVYHEAASPYNVKLAVYDYDGSVLMAPTTVGTATSTNGPQASVCWLGEGSIVVVWYYGSGVLNFAKYNATTYALTTSGTLTTTGMENYQSSRVAKAASVPKDNRFAVLFCNSSAYPQIAVYSSGGTLIGSVVQLASIAISSPSIVGTRHGAFIAMWEYSSSTRFVAYSPTGASSYGIGFASSGIGNSTTNYYNGRVVDMQDGSIHFQGDNTNCGHFRYSYVGENVVAIQSLTLGAGASNGVVCFGASPSGVIVATNSNSEENRVWVSYSGNAGTSYTSYLPSTYSYYESTPSYSITPAYGDSVFLVGLNSNRYPTVTVYSPFAIPHVGTVPANTASSPVTLSASSSTPVSLLGVAKTDCAPGSTGLVQSSGYCALGSSYSTSEAATEYNFSKLGTDAAKGFSSGQLVYIEE